MVLRETGKCRFPAPSVSSEPQYGTLRDKRDFTDVIKVKDLEMGDPGLSERAQCNHRILIILIEGDRRVRV